MHADGGDLGLRLVAQGVGPDSGESLDALCADAKVTTGAYQNFFEVADVVHRADLGIEAAKVDDGISDQLAGTMERHVTAAIDFEQLNAALGEKFRRRKDIRQACIAPQRDYRRMLQQKQRVLDARGLAHLEQRSLQFKGSAIGYPAEIEDVGDHYA